MTEAEAYEYWNNYIMLMYAIFRIAQRTEKTGIFWDLR